MSSPNGFLPLVAAQRRLQQVKKMIEEALEHYQNGNFPAAEALYRRMLDEEPGNPELLFMLSLVRQQQEDNDGALDLLNQALQIQPENATLHHALGSLSFRRGEIDAAEQAFHKAASLDPNFADPQNGIAFIEMSRGRYAAAEHALRRALKSDPANTLTQTNMGIALLEQGQASDAISYLQQVLSIEPENVTAQAQLGRAFMVDGRMGFAIQCFENVLEQMPDNPDLLELLGQARLESGQLEEAADAWRRVLTTSGERLETLIGLARAERQLGNRREAESLYLRSLHLAPGREELQVEFAEMLLRDKRWAEVIRRLTPVITAGSELESARLALSRAQLEAGEIDEAMELLRPLLSQGAPSPGTRMLFARILMDTGESEAAENQLTRLLEQDEPLAEAMLYRARMLLDQEDMDAASELLRAMQMRHDLHGAERKHAVRMLADTLHRSGKHQAAWEQYMALGTGVPDVLSIRTETPLQLETNMAADSAMQREVAWSWPPQPPKDNRPEPVFIFAWPGSDRQRLLKALQAHDGICLVADDVASQKTRRLYISHPQGAGPLNDATAADIQLARRRYWKAVRKIEPMAGQKPTIDAMWLTVEAFPTIYRLFPQAHMIILDRDPRDLVLAWLQDGHLDLDTMAETYADQLRLLQKCRDGVPLNYVNVDHRALSEDPATVLRDVFTGLGMAWDAGVETAFADSTPDYVAAPGDWEQYSRWMQPALDL
jgi:tetratricopeptide (TPR) repeat protein